MKYIMLSFLIVSGYLQSSANLSGDNECEVILMSKRLRRYFSYYIEEASQPILFQNYTYYEQIEPTLNLLFNNFNALCKLRDFKKFATKTSDITFINNTLITLADYWNSLYTTLHVPHYRMYRRMYDFIPSDAAENIEDHYRHISTFYDVAYKYNPYQIRCFNENFGENIVRYQQDLQLALQERRLYKGHSDFYNRGLVSPFVRKARMYQSQLWPENQESLEYLERMIHVYSKNAYKEFFKEKHIENFNKSYNLFLTHKSSSLFCKRLKGIYHQALEDLQEPAQGLSEDEWKILSQVLHYKVKRFYQLVIQRVKKL